MYDMLVRSLENGEEKSSNVYDYRGRRIMYIKIRFILRSDLACYLSRLLHLFFSGEQGGSDSDLFSWSISRVFDQH